MMINASYEETAYMTGDERRALRATLSRVDWRKWQIMLIKLTTAASNAYALFVTFDLANYLHSPALAFGMNGMLLCMAGFFGLFAWLFAELEPERATFAAAGCILISLVL